MARSGPAAWAGLCLILGALALLGWGRERSGLDWQPALATSQPWRAWTAVAVHYSGLHLLANLAGAALVAALGVAARVGPREVVALLIAWPLTQAGLLIQPALAHFGGLSGVLHAAVAVVAAGLLARPGLARRRIGAALLGGLLLKALKSNYIKNPACLRWLLPTANASSFPLSFFAFTRPRRRLPDTGRVRKCCK